MYYAVMSKRSVIADRIEELLQRHETIKTAADLSRESGVSESAISNILTGRRQTPRSDVVAKIAEAFGTTTNYLHGLTNDPAPNTAPPLPDYAADVLAAMRQLDRARNYELMVIARSFVQANDSISRITKEEFVNLLIDAADHISEEESNLLLRSLQALEQRWSASGSAALLPGDESDQPRKDDA